MAALTVRVLESLARDAQRNGTDRRVPDGRVPGLYAAVRPSGRITFQLRYQAERGRHGRVRVITIGTYGPGFTLEQARHKAETVRADIVNGRDPATARDIALSQQKAVRHTKVRRSTTPSTAAPAPEAVLSDTSRMAGAMAAYFKANENRFKPRTLAEWRRLWHRDVAPVLGGRAVVDVTPLELQTLHGTFRARPVIGNRVLTLLSAFFSWAESVAKLRPLGSHPVLPLRSSRFPEQRKERRLYRWEYRRLAKAMHRSRGQQTSDVTRAFIHFLALTGWREEEARTLQWDFLDAQRGSANLPDTKGGADVRVLGVAALALLKTIDHEEDNPYVFPGRTEGKSLQEPKRAWTALRQRARTEDVTLHTFRHTFATIGAELGYHDAVIGKLIGHKPRGSTTASRYTHIDVQSPILRESVNAISKKIGEMLTLHSVTRPVTPPRPQQ